MGKPFGRELSASFQKLTGGKNAGGGGRTHTPLRETDFESVASANFATPAGVVNYSPIKLRVKGARGGIPEKPIPLPRLLVRRFFDLRKELFLRRRGGVRDEERGHGIGHNEALFG